MYCTGEKIKTNTVTSVFFNCHLQCTSRFYPAAWEFRSHIALTAPVKVQVHVIKTLSGDSDAKHVGSPAVLPGLRCLTVCDKWKASGRVPSRLPHSAPQGAGGWGAWLIAGGTKEHCSVLILISLQSRTEGGCQKVEMIFKEVRSSTTSDTGKKHVAEIRFFKSYK